MRKPVLFFVLLIMIIMILTGFAGSAAKDSVPRIILYTCYRQMGWGDRVQIGWLDDQGVVRIVIGHDSDLKWPYKPEEQLTWLAQTENTSAEDKINHDHLFAITSLIYSVEDQGSKSIPAANDAGTEKSYAVQYNRDGEPVFILLGMSGDDFFENTDPNAQALYLILRRLFPGVTTYAYDTLGMGPEGFKPVPLKDFTGLDAAAVTKAEIQAFEIDCEEGPIPLELSAEEENEIKKLVQDAVVTGKADCIESSGGMTAYDFYDSKGARIGFIELEDGLLLTNDGRYYFKLP